MAVYVLYTLPDVLGVCTHEDALCPSWHWLNKGHLTLLDASLVNVCLEMIWPMASLALASRFAQLIIAVICLRAWILFFSVASILFFHGCIKNYDFLAVAGFLLCFLGHSLLICEHS
jgi:hypothetical protein